eukprot:TRINITY_DN2095_c0_g2_i1.p1 TRINITY_DN2095_c0_g2~~TRINITY_DN2095_c0_g2_i1.p1  ORF type:complete len:221 (+),score=33.67 TRINITY_DN2095_c0_g2_i1:545-1207(+)
MYNNKKITKIAMSVAVLCGFAHQAQAELYISPVVRKTVTFDGAEKAKQIEARGGMIESVAKSKSISGQSSVHGDFLMKEQPEELSTVMKSGKNVPLFVALETVIPDSSDWKINVDEGLENTVLNWQGGNSWEGVLDAISEQNHLTIEVSHAERAVGVSKNSKLAHHLAKQQPEVWRLSPTMTLRENLESWAQKSGWSLHWDDSLQIDYPINHGAVLTGKF